MAAYVIVNVDVHDEDAYAEYRAATPENIARFGGRFLARGGAVDVVEGDWRPRRLVVIEFPSMADARAWYDSEDYRRLREIRFRSATSELVMTEGL